MCWNEDGSGSGPGYRAPIASQKFLVLTDLLQDACEGWPDNERYDLAC